MLPPRPVGAVGVVACDPACESDPDDVLEVSEVLREGLFGLLNHSCESFSRFDLGHGGLPSQVCANRRLKIPYFKPFVNVL